MAKNKSAEEQSIESKEIPFDETKELMLRYKRRKALVFMPKKLGLGYVSPNLQLEKSWLSLDASGMERSFWLDGDL